MRRIRKFIFVSFLILLIIGGIVFGFFKYREHQRIKEIKKGWYIEITSDYINMREDCHAKSKKIGEVKKGEIYEVLDVNLDTPAYFFYKIRYNRKTIGWVASSRTKPFVNDVNNPTDIQTPRLRFFDSEYHVFSIDKITYKHLEVTDDRDDYKITSQVYHETGVDPDGKPIDQYWIKYTVTDGSGKFSSKVQKIVFDVTPNESEVLPFSELKEK